MVGKMFCKHFFFQISFVVVYEFNNGFSISICFIWCSTSLVSFWFVCIWPMAAFPKIVCTNTMYEEIPSLRKREDPWPTHSPQGEKEVASALAINDCEPTEIHRPWLYSEPVVIAWDFNSHHGEWGSRAHNQFGEEVSQWTDHWRHRLFSPAKENVGHSSANKCRRILFSAFGCPVSLIPRPKKGSRPFPSGDDPFHCRSRSSWSLIKLASISPSVNVFTHKRECRWFCQRQSATKQDLTPAFLNEINDSAGRIGLMGSSQVQRQASPSFHGRS